MIDCETNMMNHNDRVRVKARLSLWLMPAPHNIMLQHFPHNTGYAYLYRLDPDGGNY